MFKALIKENNIADEVIDYGIVKDSGEDLDQLM